MNVLGPRGRGHMSQYVHRLLDEFSYFLLLPILVAIYPNISEKHAFQHI
jgi:hypothetical protein